jgi:hypothetical protein
MLEVDNVVRKQGPLSSCMLEYHRFKLQCPTIVLIFLVIIM